MVDNLLSAERENVPADPRVEFVEGSIADDRVLDGLDRRVGLRLPSRHLPRQPELDRESAGGPREQPDHDAEALRAGEGLVTAPQARLRGVRVHARRAHVRRRGGDAGGRAGAARPRQPVPDLQGRGRVLLGLLPPAARASDRRARFQNVYGPREILGAGRWRGTPATVWRNVAPTFVYRALKGMPLELDNGGQATRDFVFVGDVVEGLIRCAEVGRAGRRLQPRERRRDLDPRSWRRRS